jgi:hypothetical protein
MAYNRYTGPRRGVGATNKNRLTGLFRTKRRELLTGTIDGEALDNLIAKIKDAKARKLGIVVFCWKNDRTADNPKAPIFNLSADVSTPMEDRPVQRSSSRRAIADDPTDFPEPDANDPVDDDPFA